MAKPMWILTTLEIGGKCQIIDLYERPELAVDDFASALADITLPHDEVTTTVDKKTGEIVATVRDRSVALEPFEVVKQKRRSRGSAALARVGYQVGVDKNGHLKVDWREPEWDGDDVL